LKTRVTERARKKVGGRRMRGESVKINSKKKYKRNGKEK
jgi:hypothetical protein